MPSRHKRTLLSQKMKTAVAKCYREIGELGPTLSIRQLEEKVATIFSCSRSQIRTIISQNNAGVPILDPQTGRKPRCRFHTDFLFKEELSLQVYQRNKKNEYFTARDLFQFARTELEYTASLTTLKRILKSMGYRYKKVNNRKILIEGPRLQSQKIKFLRQYLQLVDQNVTFVFLDETWIYEHGSAVRRWVFEGDRRGMPEKVCMNEGKRFTILHAGGKFGFLEGCDLFLDSKVDSRDYHKTMTGDLFKQWTEQQLIPNVKQMSGKVVVIMDNAPYHSVHAEQLPNFSWKKSKLQLWLHQNEIPFDSNLTKKQLYEIIKPNILSRKKYLIDELLSKNGIQVLRLPPYHCQYNPIEMVWGFCKQYYNKHILEQPSGKLKVANLWKKALSKYTPEMWLNSVKHCEQIIKEDWVRLMGNESVQDIPPIIISLADSDDESIISFRSESADDISLEDENLLECSEEEDERKMVCKDEQMICLLETTESENQSDVELLTVEFVD